MQMTREQHLEWAKQRALEYADRGELVNAFASLGSDLNKHDGTRNHAGIKIGMELMMIGDLDTPYAMRKFILGFN